MGSDGVRAVLPGMWGGRAVRGGAGPLHMTSGEEKAISYYIRRWRISWVCPCLSRSLDTPPDPAAITPRRVLSTTRSLSLRRTHLSCSSASSEPSSMPCAPLSGGQGRSCSLPGRHRRRRSCCAPRGPPAPPMTTRSEASLRWIIFKAISVWSCAPAPLVCSSCLRIASQDEARQQAYRAGWFGESSQCCLLEVDIAADVRRWLQGYVTLRPEDDEDMWHVYNLVAEAGSRRRVRLGTG